MTAATEQMRRALARLEAGEPVGVTVGSGATPMEIAVGGQLGGAIRRIAIHALTTQIAADAAGKDAHVIA